MADHLTVQEREKVAARYEVWNSVDPVQRWWRTLKGKTATLHPKTIKHCHAKLMTTGSVNDAHRSGRPSTSRYAENVATEDSSFHPWPFEETG